MRSLFEATLWALLPSVIVLTGCTDVCDEAAVVLDEYCGMPVDPGTEVDCDGERRAFSQCIVDHPLPACDYFYDPVAGADNVFGRCVAAIP